MRKEFFNKKKNTFDVYMINCGYEDCCLKFNCPPHKRDYHLIHYVTKGSGIYEVNGKQYTVNEGDLFFIYPGETVTYSSPDAEKSWSFCWIGFSGPMADKYLKETEMIENAYVLPLNDRSFLTNIQSCIDYTESCEDRLSQYRLNVYLFNALDILHTQYCTKKRRAQQPTKIADRAVRYIEFNYMNGIKPGDISNFLSIDRTYFYRVFRNYMHISPEQYLIQYRIGKARKEKKKNSLKSIRDIAAVIITIVGK